MDMEVSENKAGNISKANANRRKRQRAKKKRMERNGSKIMDQTCGNVETSEKIREIVTDDLEKNLPETESSVQPLVEYPEIVSVSIESLPEVNMDTKQKKKRKRVRKVKSKDEVIRVDQNKMDIGAAGNLPEGNVDGKSRKRKKKKKAAKIKDEIQRRDQTNGILNLHLSDGQEVEDKLLENKCKVQESEFSTRKELSLSDIVPEKENHLTLCQDAEPVLLSNAIEVSSNRISSESDDVRPGPSLEPMKMEGRSFSLETIQHRPSPNNMNGKTEGINEVDTEYTAKEPEFSAKKESSLSEVPDEDSLLDSCKDETIYFSHAVEDSSNRISSELGEVRSGSSLLPVEVERKFGPPKIQHRPSPNPVDGKSETFRSGINDGNNQGSSLEPMEGERKFVPLEIQHRPNPDHMDGKDETSKRGINEVNNEIVVNEDCCKAEDTNTISSCNVDVATHLSSPDVKEVEELSNDLGQCPITAHPVSCVKRKLLVLDVNGLLGHIVMPPPLDCTADAYILGRAIFKRPFCDDFLKFCFENFDVGVWSSRSKRIIDRVVSYLLGDWTDKLKFCWDMDHSTQTGFKTLENSHKPLVCKELRKIWENEDPNLPWKKEDYNESNTLLLDDSPYKALLNPLHTAIFPHSYQYQDENDNSLGPGGDLRVYLEELLTAENVQKYVEQHPSGQSAINENDLAWGFYSGVLQTMSTRMGHNVNVIPPLSSL